MLSEIKFGSIIFLINIQNFRVQISDTYVNKLYQKVRDYETMKLYKCQMLDESMPYWEECIVAVIESQEEQDFYYKDKYRRPRQELLNNNGYKYDESDIEFWFPYIEDGINYSDKMAQNISQYACDAEYTNFKLIEPQTESEVQNADSN